MISPAAGGRSDQQPARVCDLVFWKGCHANADCASTNYMAAAKSRKLESDGDSEDIFAKGNQAYTIPMHDAAFKWVLSSDEVRNSFFHVFLPDLGIQTSERIDEDMCLDAESLGFPSVSLQIGHSFDKTQALNCGADKIELLCKIIFDIIKAPVIALNVFIETCPRHDEGHETLKCH